MTGLASFAPAAAPTPPSSTPAQTSVPVACPLSIAETVPQLVHPPGSAPAAAFVPDRDAKAAESKPSAPVLLAQPASHWLSQTWNAADARRSNSSPPA